MKISWKIPIIDKSPWPLMVTINLVSLIMNGMIKANNIRENSYENTWWRIGILIITILYWFYDFFLESLKGNHTQSVNTSIYLGLILFIISEALLFFSLFFSYFYNSFLPDPSIGCLWLPYGIEAIDYLSMPLLNTIILITSGFTITIVHNLFHTIEKQETNKISSWYIITIVLGILFTWFQGLEYKWSSFTLTDSIFGSTFYILTGFHGIHVMIGLILIIISWIIWMPSLFSSSNNKFLIFSSFYWHFVDLIWLFLFFSLYYIPSL